ncbi:hypothetical protein Y032_0057g2742 [Ancylostoma ceylanicum]|uniref:Immunoglobulin I-set domain protein n=2 Tax=Ancylostoma ceylanicum TaxID=53326 RepID=A0A016U4K5_9BILA|nr:hypothetical protein Y032_0057g2742 [Ancylostoma ceylanicum]
MIPFPMGLVPTYVEGRPAPTVEWFDNNGQLITASDKYKIENTALNTVLTIKNICVRDRGEYKLRIRNRCGEDSFSISIQTTDRPGPPGKPSVQDQNVDSVRLLWSAPMQDGGSPVRYYTVEMCTASEGVWTKKETTKQPFITLFNLAPEETYIFRVRADNAFGQSDPSEESEPVYVKDVTRAVEEPKKRAVEEEEPEVIDYDRLDSKVDPSDHKLIDIHHLPNDLQAKYIICEELGQGAYGTVYRAIEKATGKTWAAKMIQVRPGVKRDDVLHEILVMNQLNHDKLLHLHEAFDLGNEMCLIEEFVSGGELFEKILEDDSLMSEEEVRDYMHQILLGVQHMHKNQIVHLDLKPENILLKSKKSTEVKIIDFGLARKLDPKKSVKLLFGTPEFCAPEVVNYQPVGLGTDMWTVGVITYVLLSGLSPFLGDTDEDTLANVSAADWDFDDPSWDDVSDEAKDFICRLMVKDKRRRMTVQDALRHPWITGPLLSAFNDLSEYLKKTQPSPTGRGPLPTRQKKNFMSLKRWSDDLLPIGRLAKRGAIFRRLTMDGVFERNISFEAECAPSVKKQLEDIVANVGDLIATLSCDIGGVPEPQITWFKDDKELVIPTPKYESRYTEGLAELDVRNIVESDAGRYSCRATNDLGSITTRATLTVGKRKADTSPAELEKRRSTKVTASDDTVVGSSPPLFHHLLTDCSAKICAQKILCVTNTTLPEPEVEWYHNGELISRNDFKYLQKHDKGRFELTILSVDRGDEGEWRVVGRNAYGECESSCKLTVEIPDGFFAPTFSRSLMDVRCEEGDMMSLTVRVTANPAPLITWYLDDIELHHSKQHRLQFDVEKREYSLTIVNCYTRDSGEYKCVAKNAIGEAESTCFARIGARKVGQAKKVDRLKAPKFHMPLANPRQIPEGTEMILTCVVSGIPQPSITWFKDGERLIGKHTKYENGVCTLTIHHTTVADAGSYTCEAENDHGSARSLSIVDVTPSPERDRFAPKFVELLANRSVFENDEILLECSVTGKPTPTITWYKDGLKLMYETRMLHYTDRKGFTRLNIMKAKPSDSGEYTCEATNALGKDFTHSNVQVNSFPLVRTTPSTSRCPSRSASPSPAYALRELRPPMITRPLTGATVTVGSREMLELEVVGNPTPTVEWYHDGKLVAHSRTLRTYFDGRVALLKIYRAQMDHAGSYTCKVSNKLGTVESSAVLTVEEEIAPHVPNMPIFIRKLEDVTVEQPGQPASLNCRVYGDPAPVLCWLLNGRAIHNDSSYRCREAGGGDASLDIVAVTEQLCGTYTVVASNAFGDAHSSAIVSLGQSPSNADASNPINNTPLTSDSCQNEQLSSNDELDTSL